MVDNIIVAVIVLGAVVLTTRRIIRRFRGDGSFCCDCKNCRCCCSGCDVAAEKTGARETVDDNLPK